MLPPTILTEPVAQVGAILILAKPENREQLIYFMGIERVRFRRPVHPGDVVEIEALVRRLRSRMGVLHGVARVDGKVVVEGTMTFALGPKNERRRPSARRSANDEQHHPHLHAPRAPRRPLRVRPIVPNRIEHRRRQDQRTDPGSFHRSASAMPRVSRSTGPVRANAAIDTPPTRAR